VSWSCISVRGISGEILSLPMNNSVKFAYCDRLEQLINSASSAAQVVESLLK
ncbi:MAG: hypothetical protein Q3961_00690, partial [Bifidobacteriaceae bacterium]|nr:hypothetical protein [Bifidobacteriaceae bacterium]